MECYIEWIYFYHIILDLNQTISYLCNFKCIVRPIKVDLRKLKLNDGFVKTMPNHIAETICKFAKQNSNYARTNFYHSLFHFQPTSET